MNFIELKKEISENEVHIGVEVYEKNIKDTIKNELVSSVSNKEELADKIKYKVEDEDYYNKCYEAEELVDLINLSHTLKKG